MTDRITLENSVAAFLKRDSFYLLMKRPSTRKMLPNIWSGVGGHIEPHELNNPMTACLREIFEETGITEAHIFNLVLRYIIIRRAKNVIRQNYIYFGETDIAKVADTDEGTLHWVAEAELLNREYSKTFEAMLKHSICAPYEKRRVVVGVSENDDGVLRMNWSPVEDFE